VSSLSGLPYRWSSKVIRLRLCRGFNEEAYKRIFLWKTGWASRVKAPAEMNACANTFYLLAEVLLSPRGLALRFALTLDIQGHGGADEVFQGRLVDLVALMNVDGAPDIALEAGVE
jgi:hypothetical protein